LENNI